VHGRIKRGVQTAGHRRQSGGGEFASKFSNFGASISINSGGTSLYWASVVMVVVDRLKGWPKGRPRFTSASSNAKAAMRS